MHRHYRSKLITFTRLGLRQKLMKLAALAGMFSIAISATIVHAATPYPNGPVRIVVGFPPGNATDTVARLLASKLEPEFKQSFIVDNRAGAAGSIGTSQAAKAKPDGMTLLVGSNGTLAINPWLYEDLPYKPLEDFAPVALLASLPMYVVVHPSVPANTLEELFELARAKPGELTFGSSGNGSANHLAAAVLADTGKVDIMHIPYKGSGPALVDLIGGRLTLMVDTAPAVMNAVNAGQVKVLAVTKPTRSIAFPDVATVAEQGYPGFDVQAWLGLLAPAGTDPAILQRLAQTVDQIAQDESFKASMNVVGAEPEGGTPEQFSQYLQSEVHRWGAVVRDLELKQN